MGDYSDLCELYGINPNDENGFDKILDIWMDDKNKPLRKNKGKWIPAPLGRKGDIEAWRKKMNESCPSPKVNEVKEAGYENGVKIGYKCTSYNGNEPVWRRVVWQENSDDSD